MVTNIVKTLTQERRNNMDYEKLKIKAEFAARVFDGLIKTGVKNEEVIVNITTRIVNGIIKGLENETPYTEVNED